MVGKILTLAMLSASCVSWAYCAETQVGDGVYVYDGRDLSQDVKEKITSAYITQRCIRIPAETFYGCSNLENVDFGDESYVNDIGYLAFAGCGLSTVVIPRSVTSLGRCAFVGCDKLSSVEFEQGSQLSRISQAAFSGCSQLQYITLPDSVSAIDNYAFSQCSRLPAITIPSNVKYIAWRAFHYCTALKSVVISSHKTNIHDGAFDGCPLEDITFCFMIRRKHNCSPAAFLKKTLGVHHDGCVARFADDPVTTEGNIVRLKCNGTGWTPFIEPRNPA
ncbi:MAG: leucine-rich repeat domain-containing protein [Holosporales bacterium]|jgi:hypothetical protein|nr:leucine-rich repeat domain-containing protein [Holosporales bacterium]